MREVSLCACSEVVFCRISKCSSRIRLRRVSSVENPIGLAQNPQCTQGHVLEVADRCRHDMRAFPFPTLLGTDPHAPFNPQSSHAIARPIGAATIAAPGVEELAHVAAPHEPREPHGSKHMPKPGRSG